MTRSEYRDDNLYWSDETTLNEVERYLERCIKNPVVTDQGCIVWNFSSYTVDREALDLESKNHDKFLIPYQITGAWATMFCLLPDEVRNAERLVYEVDNEEYKAYKNVYRDCDRKMEKNIRSKLELDLEATKKEIINQ